MRYYNQTAFKPAVAGYFAGFIVFGILYVHEFGIERFKPETIRDTILSLGYWGPLLYILCNAFRPFFFFPAIILAVAGGLAFGPLWGAIYLIIGTAFGAALCFGVARLLGRDRLKRSWFKWIILEEIDDQAARHGFRTVLILRLAPVLPWDAVSFLAGLSKVRFWLYISATVIGSVPGAIAFSYFGNVLFQSLSMAVIVTVIIIIMSIYLRVLCRGR
ncbi:TVP38/TMEM64 family protein [Sporomusa sp.]|uniref:TVP38/TMEM64 family protein n=1 Tax=Sporomusa sp. TaxID=2078658 RepID=UPI002CA787FB|nr:TVP38/TMEM64 family protein [Sporomusa sp.]HWR45142.1 TVP38/TMEM64 family protein [Sporomusa sp.]